MADLYRIFNEEGLAGLLPYAIKDTSHGYHILVDKIKAGHALSFICTHMEVPFLVVKNNTYQALFFTSEEKAEAEAADLRAQGYKPTIEDLPDGKSREEALCWLFDHGPTHILLDNSVSIPIGDLTTEIPEYDGQLTSEHMLRNRAMNGATFYYLQQAAAGYGNMEAEQSWAKALYKGKFLAACINDKSQNYPALAIEIKEKTGYLVYSDWRQVILDQQDQPSACMILDFSELQELVAQDPNNVIVFNHATCNLRLDDAMLKMIEQAATKEKPLTPTGKSIWPTKHGASYTLGQVPEDSWDKIDPTPDFLK